MIFLITVQLGGCQVFFYTIRTRSGWPSNTNPNIDIKTTRLTLNPDMRNKAHKALLIKHLYARLIVALAVRAHRFVNELRSLGNNSGIPIKIFVDIRERFSI